MRARAAHSTITTSRIRGRGHLRRDRTRCRMLPTLRSPASAVGAIPNHGMERLQMAIPLALLSTRVAMLERTGRSVLESGRPIAHVGLSLICRRAGNVKRSKRLRQENFELRCANEILKSASVLFAKGSTRTDRSDRYVDEYRGRFGVEPICETLCVWCPPTTSAALAEARAMVPPCRAFSTADASASPTVTFQPWPAVVLPRPQADRLSPGALCPRGRPHDARQAPRGIRRAKVADIADASAYLALLVF